MSSQRNKSKDDSKGDLAAKLASLPYSFSQTLPSITKKQNNSSFDRNFPQLDSGRNLSRTSQLTERTGDKQSVTVKETQEKVQVGGNGPTVAEIVAGVAHPSKAEPNIETENKEELKETYSTQVEKSLYTRLIPATSSSKTRRLVKSSSQSSFNSSQGKKQTTPTATLVSKRDTFEKNNSERPNTVILRHNLQPQPSVDKKQNIVQVDENRKKSWNVLKSNKMNPSYSTSTIQSQWSSEMENSVENRIPSSEDNDGNSSQDFIDKETSNRVHSSVSMKSSDDSSTLIKGGVEKHSNSNDDYDKFESLLRSMGWNPENGEHGEEITEEEKAQWLEMHSRSFTFLNSARYSNKITCFPTGGVNVLQAAHLRRDGDSFTDSEEEASSSELED